MNSDMIPELAAEEVEQHFNSAGSSIRKRTPKILHKPGDFLNRVINFVLDDSYMQPHLHPSDEKIERMHLLAGSFALIIFDDNGEVSDIIVLEKGGQESIAVPAFTWHTYVMLTDKVIIYETMEGSYDPLTWKKMAPWAPLESDKNAGKYLNMLKSKVTLSRYGV